MAKCYVAVGYGITSETKPGVNTETITEYKYYGDLIRNTSKNQSSTDSVNDNITVANVISIVADPFANQNFYAIKYVEYLGVKWKVTNIEVARPRLILTMGGVYNEH